MILKSQYLKHCINAIFKKTFNESILSCVFTYIYVMEKIIKYMYNETLVIEKFMTIQYILKNFSIKQCNTTESF